MGISVINQSIKFFTIFLLAFNVFAGGDDRDEEYYEALDEELASFEALLAEDIANQAALEAFQKKLADEKAAAAASTAAYQSQLEHDALVQERMDVLAIEQEIASFEAQLEAELAAQEIMAEISAGEELAKRLAEFQAKIEAEKAAAARSTAIYQARQQQEQIIKDRQAQLALERELAAFEAQLEAELAFQEWYSNFLENKAAEEALEKELAAFEAQLEAELVAAEMMAEIIAEEERAKRLAEFLAQLEAEKAAAAASTAAYQASLADEEVIGVIEEVAVTVVAHEECKHTLNLSESNIALFKSALADGSLFNVGPQVSTGTEFTANRWDEYANCVGALDYNNPF